jgi:uncharacterized SAM-binding protein YcdF (DUF218 family)
MYTLLVWDLLRPFPILVLLIGLGLVVVWWRHRPARRLLLLVIVPFALLVLLAVPAVAYRLRGGLEWQYPALAERPDDADAIVVLGSGAVAADGPRVSADLDKSGLDRCLRAAEVYHEGKPCPVVVSGGQVDPGQPASAEAMRDVLIRLGVAAEDVVLEDRSRSTFGNAAECARLLRERGLHRVVLITDATHLPRAVGCFRKQGVDVVPCGCQYRATPHSGNRYGFVPSANAEVDSQRSCHEWLGLAWYWLTGKT